jgi:arsenate reductase
MNKPRVLVLCTGNSARSQMAEGLLRHFHGDRLEVESAGTQPSRVHPEAIAAMREIGIDISGQRSKQVDEFAGQAFHYVITVCDNARESCPVFLGNAVQLHRDFPDPADSQIPEAERRARFREVRDQLADYLKEFAGTVGE